MLTTFTILYSRFLELTHFITENLYPLVIISNSPPPPPPAITNLGSVFVSSTFLNIFLLWKMIFRDKRSTLLLQKFLRHFDVLICPNTFDLLYPWINLLLWEINYREKSSIRFTKILQGKVNKYS